MRESLNFVVCLTCCLCFHAGILGTHANVVLKLGNDGPAILDSTITFYAVLRGDVPEDDYQYVFEDDTGAPEQKHTVTGNRQANFSLVADADTYKPNNYTMKVFVYKVVFKVFPQMIASGKMVFRLTEGINGNLLVGGQTPEYIPVGRELNYSFVLHDPSHFFGGAQFVYIWRFNQTIQLNKNDSTTFNTTAVGNLQVSLSVYAKTEQVNTTTPTRNGTIAQTFKAVLPINNLTVLGNVFLKRGEVMTLDVACNGSSPYRYCAKVFLDNSTDVCGGQDPVTSTQCSFRIMHYFRNAGKYKVGIMVCNELNVMNRTVDVQIYDVDKRPQLSTIIFPIASCCIGIVIVVIGAAYHLQQRRTYLVEVADFDFQEPVMLIEKSFVARVRDSIRDAMDGYQRGQPDTQKMVVNGSSRTTPVPSHYTAVS